MNCDDLRLIRKFSCGCVQILCLDFYPIHEISNIIDASMTIFKGSQSILQSMRELQLAIDPNASK